jgi:chromosome segregation protein
MLKRLELVGFKSFADKTEFEFASGVTAIVGPNGSGKSNVVDAVRWVLGEQSAKSLRGGEMSDVIFNGSVTRRSLGVAEVSMVFDNGRQALAFEAEEVRVTRRVYRGGEGEYLINGQVRRLKDVKDLFLGSGAGADAYCIIEQGRVDVLLQASTKERRSVFEEAAGVSRFKAKKTEALRRLERVDQNLLRLRDILEEVEKQLRSVQLQAAKAQRSQEYGARLKELRVTLGLRDYRSLASSLEEKTAAFEALRAALAAELAQAEEWERDLHCLEEELSRLDTASREQEADLSAARQQIAAEDAALAHGWALAEDLDGELSRSQARLADSMRRGARLGETAAAASRELQAAEIDASVHREEAETIESRLHALDAELADLRERVRRDKEDHLEGMRQAARLQNDAVSYKAQVENLGREQQRVRSRSEQAFEHLASLDVELRELTAADDALQGRLATAKQSLAELRAERDGLIAQREAAAQQAADLRAARSGLASRVEILEGLERSHEGLGDGPRELFALLDRPEPGPWGTVVGLVADVLTVRREYAPLIDLTLGEQGQRFLVDDANRLAEALRSRDRPFSSRVGFLPLTSPMEDAPASPLDDAAALPGVVGAASQVVRCDDLRLAGLPARLLGRTLIVDDLAAARRVAAARPDCRFVTLQGELLEADGSMTVGVHHAESSILSRKSELREHREQIEALDKRIDEGDRALGGLRESVARLDGRLSRRQAEVDVLVDQSSVLRSRLGQRKERRDGLHEEVNVSRSEVNALEREIQTLEESWRRANDEATRAEAGVRELESRLEAMERGARESEAERHGRQAEATAAKVALAQAEERRAALAAEVARLEAEANRNTQDRRQGERQLDEVRARRDENDRALLLASSALAAQHLRKERAERLLAVLCEELEGRKRQKQRRAGQAQAARGAWRGRQELAHVQEMEVADLRRRLDALCARLQEDYQLDLAEVHRQTAAAASDPLLPAPPAELPNVERTAAEEEIAELRRKISRLGSVNPDALQELNDLQMRHDSLRLQCDDLTAAQKSLMDVISRINADSRRLFAETFAVVRGHFQELFRKLFGGGMADVVLEDESDVLESGIEIIARPPGKELRSISLMSGGEKTLTAVALLLAVFQSKPSPFCLLDEVDAALDEANIGRFTAVLREFLDRSQFILITHSKRTMSCADVLYGVTMQESGVSRRIAVRFEDWPAEERTVDESAA